MQKKQEVKKSKTSWNYEIIFHWTAVFLKTNIYISNRIRSGVLHVEWNLPDVAVFVFFTPLCSVSGFTKTSHLLYNKTDVLHFQLQRRRKQFKYNREEVSANVCSRL